MDIEGHRNNFIFTTNAMNVCILGNLPHSLLQIILGRKSASDMMGIVETVNK
jgi:hypothetical protein